MREIIFDTETTGLDSRADRVIEIGGVELVNRFPTGRSFHVYINPQGREVNPEALAVHGISNADLVDKPTFDAIALEFLEFIDGARLVAHNAHFDLGFINAEFARCGHPLIETHRIVDTLAIAKRKHPMGPNSLDALCRRYGIDNSHRTQHGALLDSELLAEVYIEMIGGRQTALGLGSSNGSSARSRQSDDAEDAVADVLARPNPLPSRVSEEELSAHAALVAKLGVKGIWSKYRTSE